MENFKELKKELRKKLKDQLLEITTQEYIWLNQKISLNAFVLLSDLSFHQKNCNLGVFAPMEQKREASLVLENFSDWKLSFPALNDRRGLSFHSVDKDELEQSKEFGANLLVPKNKSVEASPTFVFVPGLAFDQKGVRLGRGGGFYDRYLKEYKGIKIGVCFERQLQQEIPKEEHDCEMDYIVTEHKIINCK